MYVAGTSHPKTCLGDETVAVDDFAFWSPFSLKFERSGLEKLFFGSVSPGWYMHDVVGYGLAIPFAPIFFRALGPEIPSWYIALVVFISGFFAPLNVFCYIKHRTTYAQLRYLSVFVVRCGLISFISAICSRFRTPGQTYSELLMACLLKTPVLPLIFMSFGHRVEFRYHMVLQTIAFSLSLIWIPLFCETCSSNSTVLEKFQKFGWEIDSMFSYAIMNRGPDPTVYPCWMMAALVITILGFIVPCFLIFITEVIARRAFLLSRMSRDYHSSILKYAAEAIKVAVLAFAATIVGTWFILSYTRDVLS